MKRPAPWQARRIATAKALRELPKCEIPDCTGRAFGWSPYAEKQVCPAHAAEAKQAAQRAQREKRT